MAFVAVELLELFPQEAMAREVTLFKSILLKTGAEYKALLTIEWE